MTTIHGWIKDRPRWLWAVLGLTVFGVAAATVAVSGDGDEDTTEAVAEAPAASSTTSTTSTTSTPTTEATTTTTTPATTTSDMPAITTTTRPAPATTLPPAARPGAVTVISARSGGGSGEIVVKWDAVAGATGYRVLRSGGPGGPYTVVADYDVATRGTTAAEDGIMVWSPEGSLWFEYIEYGGARVRWFQVVAYNPAGEAPPSPVVSGSPP